MRTTEGSVRVKRDNSLNSFGGGRCGVEYIARGEGSSGEGRWGQSEHLHVSCGGQFGGGHWHPSCEATVTAAMGTTAEPESGVRCVEGVGS